MVLIEALDHQTKSLILIVLKEIQNFMWVCFVMLLIVCGKEIFKFKADNKNMNFPNNFCLRSISNGFSATESRELSLNGHAYDI